MSRFAVPFHRVGSAMRVRAHVTAAPNTLVAIFAPPQQLLHRSSRKRSLELNDLTLVSRPPHPFDSRVSRSAKHLSDDHFDGISHVQISFRLLEAGGRLPGWDRLRCHVRCFRSSAGELAQRTLRTVVLARANRWKGFTRVATRHDQNWRVLTSVCIAAPSSDAFNASGGPGPTGAIAYKLDQVGGILCPYLAARRRATSRKFCRKRGRVPAA